MIREDRDRKYWYERYLAAARERDALREKLAAQPQIQVLSDGIDEAVQLAEQRIAELHTALESQRQATEEAMRRAEEARRELAAWRADAALP